MKSTLTILAVLLLAPLAALPAADTKPNILIILVDDMGYGDPGCYNPQSKIVTPQIDRLAREGMRFTDAHAPGPLCHPSRYGLMTGRHPFRTDVSKWPTQPLIRKDQATIATVLKSAGYRTAMVGKWHLGFEETGYDKVLPGGPADRGFDRFFGFRASTDIPPYFYLEGDHAVTPPTATIADSPAHPERGYSPFQGRFWRGGGISPGLELVDVLPRFTDEAITVIRDHAKSMKEKPLMLYYAPTGPHTPWLPSPEFKGRSGIGTYGDFTMMVDAMIGRVLAVLDETKLSDNTLILFTSDNGPVWYPEDVQRTGHDSAGGLRGMKSSNWEGGHRMPFIVRWPGKVKPGSISTRTICFTDIMATLADVSGVKLAAEAGPDSFSFLPVLLGTQPADKPVRESLVIGKSIRSGPWKYIEGREPEFFARPGSKTIPEPSQPPGQLFHLDDDPRETKNLAVEKPEIVARLQAELKRIRKAGRTRP
ncbi:MAG: arylsulfatase [Verrucomicrobia bacterium]|nr:arylsulfatase [Verrucomicrobiota bacterium]MBM3867207.1 arylsulfatase [Verrucomicrobiota bacterium]